MAVDRAVEEGLAVCSSLHRSHRRCEAAGYLVADASRMIV